MTRQYGALSGIAVLLIIVNHAIHFGLQVAPPGEGWLQLLILLQAAGAYAVPAFLFISGAFLAYAAGEMSFTLIRANLERILWPYVIWSGVFYALLFTTGVHYPPLGYIKHLIVGYPYHFVPLLVFWYITAPVLAPIARRHGGLLLAGVAAYQAWLLAVRFPGLLGTAVALPAWGQILAPPVLFTSLSDWAIYFPLGLVVGLHGARLRPVLVRFRSAALLATGVLFALGVLNAFGITTAPWARFAAPVPMMLVLPTIDRGSIPWLPRLEALGRRSYGIYLVHFVVLNATLSAVAGVPGDLSRQAPLLYPALLVIALGASLGLMDVLNRMPGARRLYRYMFGILPPGPVPRGFAPARAPRAAAEGQDAREAARLLHQRP